MSFKGDNINGYDPLERKWDPNRLLEGYFHSAATLNYLRGLQMAEDYSSTMLGSLDIEFLKSSPKFGSYSKTLQSIAETPPSVSGVYTAHEAMQLDLEEMLTREVPNKGYYNLSAHMVWIGDRTRQLNGGHVEYFRGIKNPIGCKVGPSHLSPVALTLHPHPHPTPLPYTPTSHPRPRNHPTPFALTLTIICQVGPSMQPDELKRLVAILNPDKIEGRLVLITRYGKDKIASQLPTHIKAVQVHHSVGSKGGGRRLYRSSMAALVPVLVPRRVPMGVLALERSPRQPFPLSTFHHPPPLMADGTRLMARGRWHVADGSRFLHRCDCRKAACPWCGKRTASTATHSRQATSSRRATLTTCSVSARKLWRSTAPTARCSAAFIWR